jgi:hypothetical protein
VRPLEIAMNRTKLASVDSRKVFGGSVRRREILGHCTKTVAARRP